MRRLLLLVLVSLTIGACADDDPAVVESGAGPTSTTTASSTTTTGAAGFGTSTVSTPADTRGLLAKVTATQAGDVDRVTFEFEGGLPGYRVGFIDRPIIEDGSGEEVIVDGDAVLSVHFEPASGFDLEAPEGRQVYKGPTRLDLATRTVLDVVRTGDFEANLEWVLGLDAKAPFRVRTETGPNRVIVEVEVRP